MSWHAVDWALTVPTVLTPTARLVLAQYARCARGDGYTWPSPFAVADRCQVTERTVRRAAAELSEAKLIEACEPYEVPREGRPDRWSPLWRLHPDARTHGGTPVSARASDQDKHESPGQAHGRTPTSARQPTVLHPAHGRTPMSARASDQGVLAVDGRTDVSARASDQHKHESPGQTNGRTPVSARKSIKAVTASPPPGETRAPAPARGRAKPKVPITEDWEPSPAVRAAMDAECPGWERRTSLPAFIDYWLGTGGTKADWDATWRRWVRVDKQKAEGTDSRSNGYRPRSHADTGGTSWDPIR